MFGGPSIPAEESEDREAVGSYALAHDLASVGERLFARAGQVAPLGVRCPACGQAELNGRANKYTRSFVLSCPNCTFRINR